MHRFFVTENFNEKMSITGKDAHHIADVLRMKAGERLQLVSLDQVSALMEISAVSSERVEVCLVEKLPGANEPRVKITLAQGLPKGDKFDFVVQKAVELGAVSIVPLEMENCVVRLPADKAVKKVARWQKIAEEAAKQAKREIVPRVESVIPFKKFIRQGSANALKILAYEVETEQGLRPLLEQNAGVEEIILLIGPEGGISKEEFTRAVEAGWHSVSLGRRILRTETACVAILAAVLYAQGELGG